MLETIFNRKQKLILSSIAISCLMLSSCNFNTEKIDRVDKKGIQHGIIYYKEDRFAGWPANNGIWSWGNEILVGFVEAPHKAVEGSVHTLDQSKRSDKYACSKDGGVTWMIEDACEHGQTRPSMSSLLNNNKFYMNMSPL